MPYEIIRRDVTLTECDAIVNPTDERYSGSGGADRAIHLAAGPRLAEECAGLPPLRTGSVAVTGAYDLPAKYVFHTVGPVWQGGGANEEALLRGCYLNALLEARKRSLRSIAFPLISSGTFGFPKDRVLRVAVEAIRDFLTGDDGDVTAYVCVLDRGAFTFDSEEELAEYLRRREPGQAAYPRNLNGGRTCEETRQRRPANERPDARADAADAPAEAPTDLAEWIKRHGESFSLTLQRLIDRRIEENPEYKYVSDVYNEANVSKGTYWKIANEAKYKPSKPTVCAFAFALRLDLAGTERLLKTAGFSLSDSAVFDRIIQFYLLNHVYNIREINEALWKYDQPLLGNVKE